MFLIIQMNNPETYILKQNRCNSYLIDIFSDEKKTVFYKTPNRVKDFDEITNFISINFLNVSFAKKMNKYVANFLIQRKNESF